MKQKILIFWNPEWIYQIDTFIENNCYIDIVVLSTEHTVSKKIQQHVNQVYYYAGPKWNERLEEDGVNIINLVNEIFSKNRYDFVFPDW